jgi:hypothetical protein
VASVSCYSTGFADCARLFGIADGTSEQFVIDTLGEPSSDSIEAGVRTMYYPRFNLILYLTKKSVYMIKVGKDS